MLCADCGFANPDTGRFCGQCGCRIASCERAAVGERRQLTVMFCDLEGSTALSQRLDPEDLRDILRSYYDAVSRSVSALDGHVSQYLGDGALVFFGYPHAHEDDPQRAVWAGLALLTEVSVLNEDFARRYELCVSVRIGIHTGPVVAGDVSASQEKAVVTAVGPTTNIAARVQEAAPSNGVAITLATRRLLGHHFVLEPLGARILKGIAEPIELFHVRGGKEAGTDGVRALRHTDGGLVGRAGEMDRLRERWQLVQAGGGEVVLIGGEPGIGKTRLVHALGQHVLDDGGVRLNCQCSPYHNTSAFYPVIRLIDDLLGLDRYAHAERTLQRMEVGLRKLGFSVPQDVPPFAALMMVELPSDYQARPLRPNQLRQASIESAVRLLTRISQLTPTLLAVEDLHWSDASTTEFVGLLLERPIPRMLVVVTFRPEFSPPWPTRPWLELSLPRLVDDAVEALVVHVAGAGVPREVVNQVQVKTDGVPLFVEELTEMILNSGALRRLNGSFELIGSLPIHEIPTTLKDLLMARLDRLATLKPLAQIAAVLGREFSLELLQAVSPYDQVTTAKGLTQLMNSGVLRSEVSPASQSAYAFNLAPIRDAAHDTSPRKGPSPPGEVELLSEEVAAQTSYTFKHILIREAAYESLLKATRRDYHERVTEVLIERFAELSEARPELLAHHLSEAGLLDEAISYWQKAAVQAVARSANVEAIMHLEKGLELIAKLSEGPERAQKELTALVTLASPLISLEGHSSEKVGILCARIRKLCRQLGGRPELFPALFALVGFSLTRGEFEVATEAGIKLLAVAQKTQDSGLSIVGSFALGATLYYRGESAAARVHLERGVGTYQPEAHSSLRFQYLFDPGVGCRRLLAVVLWLLGHPDRSLRHSSEALALARTQRHPYGLAAALLFAAVLHQYRKEAGLVRRHAEAAMAISGEYGFPYWSHWARILRDWALVEQAGALASRHDLASAVDDLNASVNAYQQTGPGAFQPYWMGLLAEAHQQTGQVKQGLSHATRALGMVERSGERVWEAELRRIRGELLLDTSRANAAEAEICFRQALDVAAVQGAKALGLRAATSLARLLQQQGRAGRGRAVLAAMYGQFTEGFDTLDLRAAKTLLKELT